MLSAPGQVIREVVGRTCGWPVHDSDRIGHDLNLDAFIAVELLVALELAPRTEFHSINALTPDLTVGDLVRLLSRLPVEAVRA